MLSSRSFFTAHFFPFHLSWFYLFINSMTYHFSISLFMINVSRALNLCINVIFSKKKKKSVLRALKPLFSTFHNTFYFLCTNLFNYLYSMLIVDLLKIRSPFQEIKKYLIIFIITMLFYISLSLSLSPFPTLCVCVCVFQSAKG